MFRSIYRRVRTRNKENLKPVIELAVEIAREGREGRRIGTLFTFGDADAVLKHSRPLILDPLAGHTEEERQIRDVNQAQSRNSRSSMEPLWSRIRAL